jgi:mRNA interferase RelE/StbE
MYTIVPHKRVIKFISSRTPKEKRRILEKFEQLKINPYPTNTKTDVKKMQNQDGFRLRVGSYRFLYDVVDNELTIYMEEADNRGDVY